VLLSDSTAPNALGPFLCDLNVNLRSSFASLDSVRLGHAARFFLRAFTEYCSLAGSFQLGLAR
jgi:hypothetical protein